MLWRNPGAVIDHLNDSLAGPRGANQYPDMPPVRRVLHRVIDQVYQRLAQRRAVDIGPDRLWKFELQTLLLLLRQYLDPVGYLNRQGREVAWLRMNLGRSGIGPAQNQQAVHQFGQAVRLLKHAGYHLAAGGHIVIFLKPNLADAADRRKRGAQFVGSVRGEAAQALERILQPGKGFVEDGRQATELVPGVLHGKPLGKTLGRDLRGLGGQGANGSQSPPRQEISACHCQGESQGDADQQNERLTFQALSQRLLAFRDGYQVVVTGRAD